MFVIDHLNSRMSGEKNVHRIFHSDRGIQVEFDTSVDAEDFYNDVIEKSGWNTQTVERSIQLEGVFVIFTSSKLKK